MEKIKKMETKTETKHVTDVEMQITNMKWEVAKGRLVIETDKGRITCRPKRESKVMVKGLETIDTVPMTIEDLPERVFEFMRIINEKGSIKVKGSYQCFDTENDGNAVTYRFLNSIKQFESWILVNGINSPSPITLSEPNKAPTIEETQNAPISASQIQTPPNSECVVPETERQRAYKIFLHEQHSLKEKLSLGMINQQEYEGMLDTAIKTYAKV